MAERPPIRIESYGLFGNTAGNRGAQVQSPSPTDMRSRNTSEMCGRTLPGNDATAGSTQYSAAGRASMMTHASNSARKHAAWDKSSGTDEPIPFQDTPALRTRVDEQGLGLGVDLQDLVSLWAAAMRQRRAPVGIKTQIRTTDQALDDERPEVKFARPSVANE